MQFLELYGSSLTKENSKIWDVSFFDLFYKNIKIDNRSKKEIINDIVKKAKVK